MPNVVRGSKQHQMRVVPDRPLRQFLMFGAVFLLVFSASVTGFLVAYAYNLISLSGSELAQLRFDLNESSVENDSLRREIAFLERASEVDKNAAFQSNALSAELRLQILELERDVEYYRKVISEEAGNTGLSIASFDLFATSIEKKYRYRIVLRQQDADGDSYLEGSVTVLVTGKKAGVDLAIPIHKLSSDQDGLDIRLRFKYFQNVEGELEIPDEFQPVRIDIEASSEEPVKKTVKKSVLWSELVTNL